VSAPVSAPGSWAVAAGDPFGVHNLPYGASADGRVLVRVGDRALDLAAACAALRTDLVRLVEAPLLDPLLAAGPAAWRRLRTAIHTWLTDEDHRDVLGPLLHPLERLELVVPFTVGDYVDFYASEQHATNLGRLFRPDAAPLTENWKHLPIGYHGRSGTVVLSGTDIVRPWGQQRGQDGPAFGPSQRLDIEAEVGFVAGGPPTTGPIPMAEARAHIFGVCLVNDWSARDIQAWEYVPLGPFLGKSFATSISPWIVPLAALDTARVPPPSRDTALLGYLDDTALDPWGFDIDLEVDLNGRVVSRPPFASMYWTAPQMLAHMTVNGASIRPGDLFASGTVSGPRPDQVGSLIELGTGFLRDGDRVTIRGTVPATADRPETGLGDVTGRVVPAPSRAEAR
jgi:fumarylacetoacetase